MEAETLSGIKAHHDQFARVASDTPDRRSLMATLRQLIETNGCRIGLDSCRSDGESAAAATRLSLPTAQQQLPSSGGYVAAVAGCETASGWNVQPERHNQTVRVKHQRAT